LLTAGASPGLTPSLASLASLWSAVGSVLEPVGLALLACLFLVLLLRGLREVRLRLLARSPVVKVTTF